MIDATIAKFRCYGVDDFGQSQRIRCNTVYEPPHGTNEENKRFYAASPSGSLELTIDNPRVVGFFEKDVEYIVEIRRASPGERT